MIKYYLWGLICVAKMGLYTKYSLKLMPMKDNKKGYLTGSTKYHRILCKASKWRFLVHKINGRLYEIGLQKDHEVSILDCVAHLERKRIRREQYYN